MKALIVSASITCCALAAPSSFAQDQSAGGHASAAVAPVNAMCPIGKEPIVPSAGTVEYKGKTIGICCPGCGKQFLAWDDARKDAFVALAVAHQEPGMEHVQHDNVTEEVVVVDAPYPLTTCPISGKPLGSMGDPVIKAYGGREVRLCCAGCVDSFEADLDASWKKVDAMIVADQMSFYPTTTCIVMGDPLTEDGEDIAINMVYANRLVRLCCKMCVKDLKADPAKYTAILDKAAADVQRNDYPLDTCLVAGGALGSMGDPIEMVVGGRLMRFCCASCEPKVKADPAKYIAMIDAAWATKGMSIPVGETHD